MQEITISNTWGTIFFSFCCIAPFIMCAIIGHIEESENKNVRANSN